MILVVGGHSRGVGKTSLVCGLIRRLPEACWTAVKITPHAHAPSDVFEERDPLSRRDTSRYLASGAARAFLVRRAAARAVLEEVLAGTPNAVIESNSVLEWLQPDLYALVLDPSNPEFKPSARAFRDRADVVVTLRPPDYDCQELFERVRARVRLPETR